MKSGMTFPSFFLFVGRVRDRDNRNEIGMTLIPVVINKILISFSDTIGGVGFFLSLAIFHH